MHKRGLRLTFYFLFILTSGICQDYQFKPQYNVALDVEKGKRLLSQCSRGTPDNITAFWKVTDGEIKLLENNFKKVKKLKSTNCCAPGTVIGNLNNYGFQYIGVTIKGKKYIYINALYIHAKGDFKTFYENWETEPLIVCDGGDYYWGVLFDLENLKFKDLMVNGVA